MRNVWLAAGSLSFVACHAMALWVAIQRWVPGYERSLTAFTLSLELLAIGAAVIAVRQTKRLRWRLPLIALLGAAQIVSGYAAIVLPRLPAGMGLCESTLVEHRDLSEIPAEIFVYRSSCVPDSAAEGTYALFLRNTALPFLKSIAEIRHTSAGPEIVDMGTAVEVRSDGQTLVIDLRSGTVQRR